MKKINFVIVIMLAGMVFFTTRGMSEELSFEQEYSSFKYSLYKDIESMDFNSLKDFPFVTDIDHPINKKCEIFYATNQDKIKKFKLISLAQFEKTKIDVSGVTFKNREKNSTEEKDQAENNDIFITVSGKLNTMSFLKIALINPLNHANMLINIELSRTLPPEELTFRAYANSLAMPLFKTKKISETAWEIIIDEYRNVFVFSYDLSKNTMTLVKSGTRTPAPSKEKKNE